MSVVDTEFIVGEDEGALHLCLQVSHTVRTRAVVDISTSSESAIGMKHSVAISRVMLAALSVMLPSADIPLAT